MGAPIVQGLEKGVTLRFWVDYSKLNVIAVLELYPILWINECVDSFDDATILLTLDTNSTYWQVEYPMEIATELYSLFTTDISVLYNFHFA